jgi:hypothetical protein
MNVHLLRFLGIILRVLRFFCMDLLSHREGGMVFYQVFLPSPSQCTVTIESYTKLREFDEIKISRQS